MPVIHEEGQDDSRTPGPPRTSASSGARRGSGARSRSGGARRRSSPARGPPPRAARPRAAPVDAVVGDHPQPVADAVVVGHVGHRRGASVASARSRPTPTRTGPRRGPSPRRSWRRSPASACSGPPSGRRASARGAGRRRPARTAPAAGARRSPAGRAASTSRERGTPARTRRATAGDPCGASRRSARPRSVRAAWRYFSSGSAAPASTGRSSATTLRGSRAARSARCAGEITSYGGATTRARSGTDVGAVAQRAERADLGHATSWGTGTGPGEPAPRGARRDGAECTATRPADPFGANATFRAPPASGAQTARRADRREGCRAPRPGLARAPHRGAGRAPSCSCSPPCPWVGARSEPVAHPGHAGRHVDGRPGARPGPRPDRLLDGHPRRPVQRRPRRSPASCAWSAAPRAAPASPCRWTSRPPRARRTPSTPRRRPSAARSRWPSSPTRRSSRGGTVAFALHDARQLVVGVIAERPGPLVAALGRLRDPSGPQPGGRPARPGRPPRPARGLVGPRPPRLAGRGCRAALAGADSPPCAPGWPAAAA